MKEKCEYYGKPKWCPYNCNECLDYVDCAGVSGVVRSCSPFEAEGKVPYPWRDEAGFRVRGNY